MTVRVDHLLREASALLGCEKVAIRCDCENLETVYVERADGQLMATDRGETYGYLSRGADDTYDLALLSNEQARSICAQHAVEFHDKDPGLLPRIRRPVGDADDVSAAVRAVSAAIDEIFKAARGPSLRS